MTDTNTMTVDGGMGTVKDCLDAAFTSMEAMRQAVQRKVEELNNLDADTLKGSDLAAIQRDLGRTLSQLIVEEGKAADALRIERGGDGICLDTARDSIGRKLDRIAEAIAEDGVPHGVG